MKKPLYLIDLNKMPILEMLQLEEALLRTQSKNFCLINTGSTPAIVMGISGKVEELLHVEKVRRDGISVIRRFSGGGTVYIDEETLFITFISSTEDLGVKPVPKAILNWSEHFYKGLFSMPDFSLRENDFVLGDRKMGGNAEYLRSERALLHTSFLWDYCHEKMEVLLLPKKRPSYREDRGHEAFLTRLKERFESKKSLKEKFLKILDETFDLKTAEEKWLKEIVALPHRKTTSLVNI